MTLVDSNIILDVITRDPLYLHWSKAQLAERELSGQLVINDVIFAEICGRSVDLVAAKKVVAAGGFVHLMLPKAALFRAAQAFKLYRSREGTRTGVLPDFFIGAHAEILGCPLLTRDVGKYRSYFPDVPLLTPSVLQ